MPVNYISDYIVINQGGTPGTAGTGSYFVASLGDVFEPALASAASADPTTLTAYEGSIIWHAGAPFIWNGTGYEAVRAAAGAATPDARLQVAATAPTLRADGSALVAGDLWVDTTTDAVLVYDGTAYVGGAAGGNSTIVDNGDNTVTHTSGSGAVTTLMKAPSHVAAPAAPATPFVGDTWYDTVNSKLFQRANDGTTDIWVDITASAAASGLDPRLQASATAPTARGDTTPLAEGDLWYDTAADALKTYDGAAWQGGGGGAFQKLAAEIPAYNGPDGGGGPFLVPGSTLTFTATSTDPVIVGASARMSSGSTDYDSGSTLYVNGSVARGISSGNNALAGENSISWVFTPVIGVNTVEIFIGTAFSTREDRFVRGGIWVIY